MNMKLADDCFFHDQDRIPHNEALTILKSRVRPVVRVEDVSLDRAAGRYLAAPILAPRAIPAHDNAAVDGYAFAFVFDLSFDGVVLLPASAAWVALSARGFIAT